MDAHERADAASEGASCLLAVRRKAWRVASMAKLRNSSCYESEAERDQRRKICGHGSPFNRSLRAITPLNERSALAMTSHRLPRELRTCAAFPRLVLPVLSTSSPFDATDPSRSSEGRIGASIRLSGLSRDALARRTLAGSCSGRHIFARSPRLKTPPSFRPPAHPALDTLGWLMGSIVIYFTTCSIGRRGSAGLSSDELSVLRGLSEIALGDLAFSSSSSSAWLLSNTQSPQHAGFTTSIADGPAQDPCIPNGDLQGTDGVHA